MATRKELQELVDSTERGVYIAFKPDGDLNFVNVGLSSEELVGVLLSLSDAVRQDLREMWLDNRDPEPEPDLLIGGGGLSAPPSL